MPETVGNARRERALVRCALHGAPGRAVPEELRAPAREDSMSPGEIGVYAMMAVIVFGVLGLLLVGWRMRG